MNGPNFNELTHAETERLACLAEECAEVIHVIGKIIRHGYESTHPDDPDGETNQEMLESEIGHVNAVVKFMILIGDLRRANIKLSENVKPKHLEIYLHHNSIFKAKELT